MDKHQIKNNLQRWLHLKNKVMPPLFNKLAEPAALLCADEMEQHAIKLAHSHKLTKKTVSTMLLNRLSQSETILLKCCTELAEKQGGDDFSPAREWLLDNFYLIQEQIFAIRRYLPKGYGRELPQLVGKIPGYPRVYDIAREIIMHGDGRWDLENLSSFISAYQSVTILTLAELWAIPIMLGVALIENLSSASQCVVADKYDRNLASKWVDRMIQVTVLEPKKLVMILADMARSNPPLSSAFVAEFTRRLQSAALALPLSWMEQHLQEAGLTVEQLVQEENKCQAAHHVTVSNNISSLRRLSEVDWRCFVEAMSVVEHILCQDPAETYRHMDFATRDMYRHVIERLSRAGKCAEQQVADCAIKLAKIKKEQLSLVDQANPDYVRYYHVGFYLIDDGLAELKKALNIQYPLWKIMRRFIYHHALFSYLGSITLITAGLTYLLLYEAMKAGFSITGLVILGILLVLSGSQLAMSIVNLVATWIVKPHVLPRMDFTTGIPEAYRTMVVVPTILSSADTIDALVEALEIRFLGNRDPHLYFMLLTDFGDALSEHMPEDMLLLTMLQKRIVALNTRYAENEQDIFFLCHRPRRWNAQEGVWMGWERKRGKLADLNQLLCGRHLDHFSLILGDMHILSKIKYIITVDTDTQLPRESARKFVSTMAHPLNWPRYDASSQCIVEGYGILQPRVAEAMSQSGQTRYVQLCGNEFGIDPYTRTVSDVYQDLFQQGSYIGKGIYDVDAFHKVLDNRFPENHILSHDLLEGCYLRSGFLSDVPLYEKSPGNYLVDSKRRIRWIRGDWQIIGWLLPYVLNAENKRVRNPLSILSKFKIFDNLRRSIVPIALVILFILSWFFLSATYFWCGIVIGIVVLPTLIRNGLELLRKPQDMSLRQHVTYAVHTVYRSFGQLFLYIACLPFEAWSSLNAIARTSWRLFLSKRHLLEWVPYDQVDRTLRNTPLTWMVSMCSAPLIACVVCIALVLMDKIEMLYCIAPLLILWFFSPLYAYWLSRPLRRKEPKVTMAQRRFLHTMARKTWGFFETFITIENHWLPPDNFQEMPVEVLACRTSPTNIGLSLLSNLTAYDFGYINTYQLLLRTQKVIKSIQKMERYRGHLYNWYNTQTLEPLSPRYVSTVDSGNLAGHLLTLRQGLLALQDEPLLSTRYLNGLEDTFYLLTDNLATPWPLALSHFKKLLDTAKGSFAAWSDALMQSHKLCGAAEEIVAFASGETTLLHDMSDWSQKLLAQCIALRDEMRLFSVLPKLSITATLRDVALLTSSDLITTEQNRACCEAKRRVELINTLVAEILLLSQMDMSFLYDPANHLMTIGFNVDEQRCDRSYYDLLCSEARLGIFVAIAQGQIFQESWFSLGRLLVSTQNEPVLISWSGSMFEYLMPLLVMPTYSDTLLDQTYHAVVRKQISYGQQQGVPWGVSESGYNALDAQFNYLYRAFGVPGLGLQRGLENDLVIAPYASAMALMVNPEVACLNLQKLYLENVVGKFGFYEAIDFTKSRLPPDSKRVVVRSFMAHHQGMSFLAFSYFLHQQPMQRRFTADPLFQATLLLLQERIPKPTTSYLQIPNTSPVHATQNNQEVLMRTFNSPNTRTPQVQLLSNGCYHLVLTQAGGNYSRWKDLTLTRWREDSTCDNWGLFSYICDVTTGQFCATTYQPTLGNVRHFKALFSETQVEFKRQELHLDLHTEIVVSPEDDIELRRLHIHNHSRSRRTLEFTSYAEVVLAPQNSDLAQPAFSNLFVETEILQEYHAILATRRPQDAHQEAPFLCHVLNSHSEQGGIFSFETDRLRFLGRDGSTIAPLALRKPGPLSNTQGAVLDPIVAIRCRIVIEAHSQVILDLLTGVAATRTECVALVKKYQDRHLANRIFGLAWTHGQVLLHQLNISGDKAQLYQRLASAIIYASNTRRAAQPILMSNRQGQSGLWKYSISGDLPIVLVHIEEASNIELIKQLIQAQGYWRQKGLLVDVMIINKEHVSYRQLLQNQIMSLLTGVVNKDHGGSIVVRTADQVPAEDLVLLQSVARVILSDQYGTLKEQLAYRIINLKLPPLLRVNKFMRRTLMHKLTALSNVKLSTESETLQFFNGLGGFTQAGDEYCIRLQDGICTPTPWVNILANPNFGTLVSESGQGYTWSENSHEFRLTPWDNDPVRDSGGEALYIRDDVTGLIWSPTALPCRGSGDYYIRHGFGYSVFEHMECGIHSQLWVYVAKEASVKYSVLTLRNDSKQRRRLTVMGYVAWVLGDLRTKNSFYVVTELMKQGGLLAQNHYNSDFSERAAFFDVVTPASKSILRSVTANRTEFLGRNGTMRDPAALKRQHLSGCVGAGFDPCAVLALSFDLEAGESREIVFTLGAAQTSQQAQELVERYRGLDAAHAELTAIRDYWKKILTTVQVKTPDNAFDLMANGWLVYQVLSSRLWGRTGYYQSSGAFGFRDQLQDVMALVYAEPMLLRAQILLAAAHQFVEGDVLHWWHPPQGRGVRTRCSDDYLWLPFVLCYYIEHTGDMEVLNEMIPFLEGRLLKPEEESYYDLPTVGKEKVSLYQHAVRSIEHGLRFGQHGLPLMGSGDWNDGMNLVGIEGRGESVWLAFFLHTILKRFAPISMQYGDTSFAARCDAQRLTLQQQIEAHAWDGQWYRRAYFDDGTPLGSANNSECRIDSLAQSWSVLSGAADSVRAAQAMQALQQQLVDETGRLVKLLDPPFVNFKPNPGYIQGYVAGIRENGGQYTHAAMWAIMAFAQLGDTQTAWQLATMLNPIHHGSTIDEVMCYKLEPYVLAGDVYSVAPHVGRGGWSWYTGSAGWFYRVMIESLLGVQIEGGNRLYVRPQLLDAWDSFIVEYHYKSTTYHLTIQHAITQANIVVDGVTLLDDFIALVDDGHVHEVLIAVR